jgi:hypothetical protein
VFKNHAKKLKLNDNQSENEDIQAENVGSQHPEIIVEQHVSNEFEISFDEGLYDEEKLVDEEELSLVERLDDEEKLNDAEQQNDPESGESTSTGNETR